MGVDIRCVLPGNVRVDDVAKVIGIAVGLKPEYRKFNMGNSDGGATYVDGITVNAAGSVDTVQINFDGRYALYFFEPDIAIGKRLFYPKSTPFWIAACKRLVDFFGGTIDYNDCDEKAVDYRVKAKSNSENCPSDDEPWETFQQRLLTVPRIHKSEMVNPKAAYDGNGEYKYEYDADGFMIRGKGWSDAATLTG